MKLILARMIIEWMAGDTYHVFIIGVQVILYTNYDTSRSIHNLHIRFGDFFLSASICCLISISSHRVYVVVSTGSSRDSLPFFLVLLHCFLVLALCLLFHSQ